MTSSQGEREQQKDYSSPCHCCRRAVLLPSIFANADPNWQRCPEVTSLCPSKARAFTSSHPQCHRTHILDISLAAAWHAQTPNSSATATMCMLTSWTLTLSLPYACTPIHPGPSNHDHHTYTHALGLQWYAHLQVPGTKKDPLWWLPTIEGKKSVNNPVALTTKKTFTAVVDTCSLDCWGPPRSSLQLTSADRVV